MPVMRSCSKARLPVAPSILQFMYPSLLPGSESSKASGQKCAGSSPASSIEAQHQIPALHHMPQAAAAPAAATSGNPLADRPAWTEPPAAMQPTAVPSDSNPYLSSGSMHGDGDWLAGGINSHRNSYHSPSVKASSDLASDNTQIDSSAGQPNTLPVTVSSKPILGDSGQPDNMGMYQASGNPPPAGNSSASFGSHSKPTPASTMRPQAKQQAALPPSASPAAGLSHGVGQSSTMQEHVNHSPQQEAGVQQFANSQLGGQWQSAVAQQPVVTVQPSSAPFCPVTQSQPPTASQVHAAVKCPGSLIIPSLAALFGNESCVFQDCSAGCGGTDVLYSFAAVCIHKQLCALA